MSIEVFNKPFFNLPEISINGNINDFILNSNFYEKVISQRTEGKLNLADITKDSLPIKDINRYEEIVPYNMNTFSNNELLSGVIKKAKKYPNPFSKSIKNLKELGREILLIYQVAHAHYAIAKHYGFEYCGIFPDGCCGPSGKGGGGTFWIHGMYNATYASYNNRNIDHGYNILPFVMQEPFFKGVILADFTSEQLGKYKGEVRRNLVTIKQGTDWVYNTDYDFKADLFPFSILHLATLLKKGSIRDNGELAYRLSGLYFQDGRKFLELAFSNPLDLSTEFNI